MNTENTNEETVETPKPETELERLTREAKEAEQKLNEAREAARMAEREAVAKAREEERDRAARVRTLKMWEVVSPLWNQVILLAANTAESLYAEFNKEREAAKWPMPEVVVSVKTSPVEKMQEWIDQQGEAPDVFRGSPWTVAEVTAKYKKSDEVDKWVTIRSVDLLFIPVVDDFNRGKVGSKLHVGGDWRPDGKYPVKKDGTLSIGKISECVRGAIRESAYNHFRPSEARFAAKSDLLKLIDSTGFPFVGKQYDDQKKEYRLAKDDSGTTPGVTVSPAYRYKTEDEQTYDVRMWFPRLAAAQVKAIIEVVGVDQFVADDGGIDGAL